MAAWLGPLWALGHFGLAFFMPSAAPAALLFGTVDDRLLHLGPLNIFAIEWALLGVLAGLAWRKLRGAELPVVPGELAWPALLLPLIALLHAFGPGPAGAALKDALRLGQFTAAMVLPAWLCRGRKGRLALGAFALWAAAAAGLAGAQWVLGPGHPLNAGHEIEVLYGTWQATASFFQHHNQAAAAFVASLALATALAWQEPRWAWSALALLLSAALIATASRGAWVGVAVGILLALFKLPRRAALMAGAALILVAVLGLVFGGSALRTRISSLGKPQSDRAMIWQQGVAIAGPAWAWGRGPGAVQAELPQRIAAIPGLDPQDSRQYASHLHSQWLQAWVELGLLGLLAWAFLLGALLRRAWSAPSPWGPALLVALTAFALQASTDLLTLHARGMAVALCWGLLLAQMERPSGSSFWLFGQAYFTGSLEAAAAWVVKGKGSRYVCVANVHTAMQSLWDPDLRRASRAADLSVPDGRPLSLLGRLNGIEAQQVRGADLMEAVARQGLKAKAGHYFYGGKPGVAEAAAAKLQALVPGARIAGLASPSAAEVTAGSGKALAAKLKRSKATVLWVGLGAPKQEQWMQRMRGQLPVTMVGVGAAFDYHAGTQAQAPRWMQRLALEWLFRLFNEPGRLWKRYLLTNTAFLLLAPIELLGLWPKRRP